MRDKPPDVSPEDGVFLPALFAVAVLVLRRTGRRPSPGTVSRWCLRGIQAGPRVVRLNAVKLGGRGWHCSEEALDRFLAEQAAAAREHVAVDGDGPIERTPAVEDALRRERLL